MSTIESGWHKWFSHLVAAVLDLMGVAFLAVVAFDLIPAEDPQMRAPMIGFLLLFNAFGFYLTYDLLGYPTRIVVHPDGSFVLHSPLRAVRLSAAQVRELDCDGDGDWYLRHAGGKADLRFFRTAQMTGFLQHLKARNPAIASSRERR